MLGVVIWSVAEETLGVEPEVDICIWLSDSVVVWYGEALDVAVNCVACGASGKALDKAVVFN